MSTYKESIERDRSLLIAHMAINGWEPGRVCVSPMGGGRQLCWAIQRGMREVFYHKPDWIREGIKTPGPFDAKGVDWSDIPTPIILIIYANLVNSRLISRIDNMGGANI